MKRIKQTVAHLLVLLVVLAPATAFADDQSRSTKPLKDKENPEMIGKRNINKRQWNFFSIEREIALGRQLAGMVEQQMRIVDDPIVTEYINRVGQNIVLHSDAKVPFTIKVVASEEINAFALPGGYFYVNTGLILAADNESELAGVMAHEIAHVAARHAMENMTKSQVLSWASIPLIFVGGAPGILGRLGASFGLPVAFFKFSRGAEKEADILGAQYSWASGYDPNGLWTMFEKLWDKKQQEPKGFSKLFTTHPAHPDRIKITKDLIARFPERDEYIINSWEFNRVKERLARMQGRARKLEAEGKSGQPERPTLKRRQPTDPDQPPAEEPEQTKEKPKLKRQKP